MEKHPMTKTAGKQAEHNLSILITVLSDSSKFTVMVKTAPLGMNTHDLDVVTHECVCFNVVECMIGTGVKVYQDDPEVFLHLPFMSN